MLRAHLKDVDDTATLADVKRPMAMAAEHLLFQRFISERLQIILVVDEFGTTVGIVSSRILSRPSSVLRSWTKKTRWPTFSYTHGISGKSVRVKWGSRSRTKNHGRRTAKASLDRAFSAKTLSVAHAV